jgi:hypothetical protein
MKCVVCGDEAEHVQFGMSICEKHFKAESVGNRDVDLVKVKIFADKCHTFFTSRLSVILVVFSLVGVFYGLYFQGIFTSNIPEMLSGLMLIGVTVIVVICFANRERQVYSKDFTKVSRY